MRGINSTKVKYINELLKISSILFLEELWLSDKQISELSAFFPGYNVHQGWGQVQLTKYSSTPSTPTIYQVQVLVKYSFFLKST